MSATTSNPIILYDFSTKRGPVPLSSNAWKTRLTLNLKKIPYRTEWVKFLDIESTLKERGFTPATKSGRYTIPTIVDPTSSGQSKLIMDSLEIAKHLDKAYPDTKSVFPPGTERAQEEWWTSFEVIRQRDFMPLCAPRVPENLDPESSEFFKKEMQKRFNKPLSEVAPTGKAREEKWESVRQQYTLYGEMIDQEGNGGPYAGGESPIFKDTVMIAILVWFRELLPEDEWKMIESWHDGRWKRLLEASAPLLQGGSLPWATLALGSLVGTLTF
jgi:glutathione S-transferase